LIAVLFMLDANQPAWAVACLIAGAVSVLQGIAINMLFKAGAEVTRLLKKSNGLKFSGEISQPVIRVVADYVCSVCGASANVDAQTKCYKCGARFEPGSIKGKTESSS